MLQVYDGRKLSNSTAAMIKISDEMASSAVRRQAADALRRARKLPVGPARNDLRQLAIGLLWLEKKGLQAKVMDRMATARFFGGSPD